MRSARRRRQRDFLVTPLMMRRYLMSLCGFIGLAVIIVAKAQTPNSAGPAPIRVPLTVSQTARGTFKAAIDVGIGNLKPIPFVFDTGSTGLHVYADASLIQSNNGIVCTQTKTQVKYGNPPRITLTGVMCQAVLHIGSVSTAEAVPFAYLTAASCSHSVKKCPDPRNPKQMGAYGIFGAGIAGIISGTGIAPPPILSLPGRYGEIYTVAIGPRQGELILGSYPPANAVIFRLLPVMSGAAARWSLGRSCLFVNGSPIGTCLTTSFDTGNGVPWLHNVANPLLPIRKRNGEIFVRPSTVLGFGPEDSDEIGTTVTAGSAFANTIEIEPEPNGRVMTNTGIQAFFGHLVTYNAVYGNISFAPQRLRGSSQ